MTSGNDRYVSSSHRSSGTLSASTRTTERSYCSAAARPCKCYLFGADLLRPAQCCGRSFRIHRRSLGPDLESGSGPQILREFDTMLARCQVPSNLQEALQLGRLTAPSKLGSGFRRVVVADGQWPAPQPNSNESGWKLKLPFTGRVEHKSGLSVHHARPPDPHRP